MSQELGESNGGPNDLDGLPMGSIVYMGRGSFRMEAVAIDTELERLEGVVQPLAGVVVTAPMHAGERGRHEHQGHQDHVSDATTSTGTWQAPDLRPLFSSQVDVPMLAAPTGSAGFSTTPISISRLALVALGGLVLLCGVVIGTAVRHLLASPAAISTVSVPAPSPAAAPIATPIAAPIAAPIFEAQAPAAALVALPAPAVQAPVAIQATAVATVARPHVKPAAKRAPVETVRKAPVKAIAGSASHWVDPFAE